VKRVFNNTHGSKAAVGKGARRAPFSVISGVSQRASGAGGRVTPLWHWHSAI